MRIRRKKGGMALLAIPAITAAIWVAAVPEPASAQSAGASRLVSVQHILDTELCRWETPLEAQSEIPLMAALQRENLLTARQQQITAPGGGGVSTDRVLEPVRAIRDLEPTYSAIAFDAQNDEVILQDNNLWSYRVFDRLDNTPSGARFTEPKRHVQGDKTQIQFNNGLYVDPNNGDIYSLESDVGDKMIVFAHDANGNVAPKRTLHTLHRVYNLAVDEAKSELFVTVEFPPEVDVYHKDASGEDLPIRRLVGPNTGLNSVHGIAVDEENQLMYVNTWGHYSDFTTPGTGGYEDPAIKIYALNASGDTPPLRVIQGDQTQLNWPAAMKLNPENGDLYVANDIGQSILVFAAAARANGNVAPARVIKGDQTLLSYPTGIALDLNNGEVWVSNMGTASATAYPLMADGNIPPVRRIRSAADGKKALNFGRTTAVAYDSTREQILVPN